MPSSGCCTFPRAVAFDVTPGCVIVGRYVAAAAAAIQLLADYLACKSGME